MLGITSRYIALLQIVCSKLLTPSVVETDNGGFYLIRGYDQDEHYSEKHPLYSRRLDKSEIITKRILEKEGLNENKTTSKEKIEGSVFKDHENDWSYESSEETNIESARKIKEKKYLKYLTKTWPKLEFSDHKSNGYGYGNRNFDNIQRTAGDKLPENFDFIYELWPNITINQKNVENQTQVSLSIEDEYGEDYRTSLEYELWPNKANITINQKNVEKQTQVSLSSEDEYENGEDYGTSLENVENQTQVSLSSEDESGDDTQNVLQPLYDNWPNITFQS